ncbi:hypothetical protein SOVF_205340, partial [Spinacia oleracea]
ISHVRPPLMVENVAVSSTARKGVTARWNSSNDDEDILENCEGSWSIHRSGFIPQNEDGETEHVVHHEDSLYVEPVSKEPHQTWANIVTGANPPLTAKGTSLSFISPTILDGKPVALLDKIDLDKMTNLWDCSIVMYVVGNKPSIGAVIRFIAKEWVNIATPKVFLHDEGYFIFQFSSKKDRDVVLMAGPYSFFNRQVIVKPWAAKFNFQEEILRVIPLWVRLPNLPLNCWGSDSLSRIGSVIGVPLFADECTSKQLRVSFARLLIEVDVTKPVQRQVLVQDPSGVTFTQPIAMINTHKQST